MATAGEAAKPMWTGKAAVVLLFILVTPASLAAHREFDKRFQTPPQGHLTVSSDTGSVTVVGQDTPEIVVHAEVSGSAAAVDRFIVAAEQDSSGVKVSGRSGGRFGWDFSGVQARFTIAVPRAYSVEVVTAGGEIDVQNVKSGVQAVTSGGGINIRDVAGSVIARTSGGGIGVEGLRGPVELRTAGGSIHARRCTGDLEARTSGGGITLDDIDGRVTARTSGGGIHAEVLVNHGVSLTTSGGGITLLLPADVRASVDASTSGGEVGSEFPFSSTETLKRAQIRGAIHGGGEPVRLHTSGGGIHLGTLTPS
jgi:hypothetical protein